MNYMKSRNTYQTQNVNKTYKISIFIALGIVIIAVFIAVIIAVSKNNQNDAASTPSVDEIINSQRK